GEDSILKNRSAIEIANQLDDREYPEITGDDGWDIYGFGLFEARRIPDRPDDRNEGRLSHEELEVAVLKELSIALTEDVPTENEPYTLCIESVPALIKLWISVSMRIGKSARTLGVNRKRYSLENLRREMAPALAQIRDNWRDTERYDQAMERIGLVWNPKDQQYHQIVEPGQATTLLRQPDQERFPQPVLDHINGLNQYLEMIEQRPPDLDPAFAGVIEEHMAALRAVVQREIARLQDILTVVQNHPELQAGQPVRRVTGVVSDNATRVQEGWHIDSLTPTGNFVITRAGQLETVPYNEMLILQGISLGEADPDITQE
ncbi:hypothetical protein KGQ71_02320, partial [Patescibacteria group bacterium]|nr:hypothetical protein [Patescibacteria group bacterium]